MTELVYEPRGAAQALMRCRAPEVLVEGPAGTGKTRAVLTKIRLALEKYPGSRALLFRKTRESLTETVLVEWEGQVIGPEHPMIADGPSRRVRQSYEFPNGSVVVVGGMDKPAKVMSAQYDLVAGFEATELLENDWEMVLTRLRNGVMPYQQGVADCNPGAPTHWLNRRASSGQMTRLLSRHEDNPRWYGPDGWTDEGERYVNGTLAKLTGVRLARLKHGQWAAADGMVYSEWDAASNVIDRFSVPDDWRRIRSIDFGFTHPFVCQWWAIDGDGRMYLYRELYQTGRLTVDLAGRIVDLSRGETIETTVSDHDPSERATLEDAGIYTVPAIKDVESGIQAVAHRMRKADDGRPRLMVMRDCLVGRDASLVERHKPTCTLEEIEGYVFAKTAGGHVIKEVPVKEDDHGMDAMRYAVMHVDRGVRMIASVVSPGERTASVESGDVRGWFDRMRADPDWGFSE